jgi:hypothetical protein
MSKGGAASTFVTAGAVVAMVESIEGVDSVIGVGFGFWRFGRGELGGEVADIVVVKGIVQRDGDGVGRRVDAPGVRVEYCPLMVSDIRTIRILKHIFMKPVGLHYQRTKCEFPQHVFS